MATIQTVATDIGQVSINPQGEYSAGTQYHVLDVVTYNGSSYISVKDSLNKPVSNTTYWYLLASKGDTYEVTPEDLQAIADQITQDASSAFNQNVTAKTNEFNQNAVDKTTNFNNNATSKTTDFNSNATSKTTTFNNNASSKTDAFDLNATNQTIAFDGNYTDKVGLFNGNATDKTTAFDNNASSKTTDFNSNATSKTTDFNSNATSKTNTFNANAQDKVDYYNTNADSLIALSGGVLEQIPTAEVNNTVISVDDSAGGIPPKDISILGNTSQATDVLTYTCIGTELGDYYFVYEDTNYQFTMPSISAGSVLAFNTTSLKLFLGDTEIATTTASTGTLITLEATPNPDYPQDIKVVTGDVDIKTCGKNLWSVTNSYTNISATVTFTYNANGTITANGTASGGANSCSVANALTNNLYVTLQAGTYTISGGISENMFLQIYNENGEKLASDDFGTGRTITLAEETKVIIRAYISAGTVTNNDVFYIQIETGNEKTSYEPYQGKNVTLPLGSLELAKIGNYADVLFKNSKGSAYYKSNLTENAWYKLKNINKLVLTGNESGWSKSPNTTEYDRFIIGNIGNSKTSLHSKCSHFKTVGEYTGVGQWRNNAETQLVFNFTLYGTTTLEQWKAWLNDNNITLFQPANTPTYTQITDTALLSKLEELANSNTYKPITNIYTSTDNEEPNIYMVYRKDLTKMFSDLSNAIISLGNNT